MKTLIFNLKKTLPFILLILGLNILLRLLFQGIALWLIHSGKHIDISDYMMLSIFFTGFVNGITFIVVTVYLLKFILGNTRKKYLSIEYLSPASNLYIMCNRIFCAYLLLILTLFICWFWIVVDYFDLHNPSFQSVFLFWFICNVLIFTVFLGYGVFPLICTRIFIGQGSWSRTSFLAFLFIWFLLNLGIERFSNLSPFLSKVSYHIFWGNLPFFGTILWHFSWTLLFFCFAIRLQNKKIDQFN